MNQPVKKRQPLREIRISEEIEESYAEIGKALVESGIAQYQDILRRMDRPDPDNPLQLVVSLPLWITGKLNDRDPSIIEGVCCVCERDENNIIICRGKCC